MNEERLWPGHWLGSVLRVSLSGSQCWLDDRKEIRTTKKPVPLVLKSSLLEQVQ